MPAAKVSRTPEKGLSRYHELVELQLQGRGTAADLREREALARELGLDEPPAPVAPALAALRRDRQALHDVMARIEDLLTRSRAGKKQKKHAG